jgi:hypothetical protein
MTKKYSTIAKLPTQFDENKEGRVGGEANEAELLAFIKKGGSSARPAAAERATLRKFTFRVKEDIVSRIEKAVASREVQTTNTAWITEAILEKLKREHF